MLPLFCDAPLAARAHCAPTQGAPLVTADLRQPPVAYRASTGSALRAQAQANGTPLGRGGGILGLTVNRYDVGMHVAVAATRDGGEYCATLRSASIAFAAKPQVLFDERFAPEHASARPSSRHESEHVAVFRDAIAAAAPEIEAALHGAALPPRSAPPRHPMPRKPTPAPSAPPSTPSRCSPRAHRRRECGDRYAGPLR